MFIKGIKGVHTDIKLTKIDNKNYSVDENIEYYVGKGKIIVPKGFITDLASVPECLQWVIKPYGEHSSSAILHDFLYSKYNTYGINKMDSDKIFLKTMLKCGVEERVACYMFTAVSLFGEPHYESPKIDGYDPPEKSALIDKRKIWKEYLEKTKVYMEE